MVLFISKNDYVYTTASNSQYISYPPENLELKVNYSIKLMKTEPKHKNNDIIMYGTILNISNGFLEISCSGLRQRILNDDANLKKNEKIYILLKKQ